MFNIEPLILGECKLLLNNDIDLVMELKRRGYNLVVDNTLYYYGAILINEPYVIVEVNNIPLTKTIEHYSKVLLPEVSYEFLKQVYTTIP